MNNITQRKIEIWAAAGLTIIISIVLVAFATIANDSIILLIFALPFLALTFLLIHKARRSDEHFIRESRRDEEFIERHPLAYTLLMISGVIVSVWWILLSLIRSLT